VNGNQWLNRGQPQTLQNATILCYIDAVLGLLNGIWVVAIGLFIVVGLAAGGYGIANERKWGYALAVAAAIVQVLIPIVFLGFDVFSNVGILLSFLFDVALVALLLHPQSRSYQKIWFR
jgi:hypothetical protein